MEGLRTSCRASSFGGAFFFFFTAAIGQAVAGSRQGVACCWAIRSSSRSHPITPALSSTTNHHRHHHHHHHYYYHQRRQTSHEHFALCSTTTNILLLPPANACDATVPRADETLRRSHRSLLSRLVHHHDCPEAPPFTLVTLRHARAIHSAGACDLSAALSNSCPVHPQPKKSTS